MMSKLFDVSFRKELELVGFEILTLKELYENNDGSFLASSKRLNFYEILFIEQGEGSHFVDFMTYPLQKGDILFIGKNQVYAWQKSRTCKGCAIHWPIW